MFDTDDVGTYLPDYLLLLNSEGKVKAQDFEDGISKMSEILPDLACDLPQIHRYMWDMVLSPLVSKEIIHLSKITWTCPDDIKPKEEEADEDDFFFGTEPFFKLLALVLASVKEPDLARY